MNRIYRVIWSRIRNAFVVVGEIARSAGKSATTCDARRSSHSVREIASGYSFPWAMPPLLTIRNTAAGSRSLLTAVLFALAAPAFAADPASNALPTGGQITAGSGSISTAGNAMTVRQDTDKLIANWQSFNIGASASVTFNQPGASSVALNRVLSQDPSQILGHLNANGQVMLVNPAGVVFGQGSQVNVGGITATTLNITDADFLAGNHHFSDGANAAAVQNLGHILADGGVVALVAPVVQNEGSIETPNGAAALAAGNDVTLDFSGDGLVSVTVSQGTLDNLIENRGAIRADNGLVILTAGSARDLLSGVVNNSGIVEAKSLAQKGGRIVLEGGDITLAGGSVLDASGATGGGDVLVGGGWQGSGTTRQATTVTMESGAVIDASATQTGDGGQVVLWSDVSAPDSATAVRGTILARGGAQGGDGGRVETSGHTVDIDGVQVDAGAPQGQGGLWLIDPYNYTIGGGQASTIVGSLDGGTSVTVDTTANIAGYGSSGNSADAGDITVTAAIAKAAGTDATLTLKAARHIELQSGAAFSSSSGKLNLQFWADSDNSGDGINKVSTTSIATNGGWIKFGNNQTATINGSSVLVGGDVYFNGASAQTISTGGGDLDIYGETILGNTSGLTINTAGGNVGLHGLLNSGNQYTWVDKTADTSHDWNWARTDAKNGTAGGSTVGDSYLVTITSRLENAIAGLTAGYRGAWIGAYRASPGSSYAWTWADGPEGGVQFFTQSAGNGGTTTAGYYSNFGSGEPNGALNPTGESVGQFFGTAGQWNDLTATTQFSATQASQYAVLGYVRETNLSASPLTINAGSGSVTIDGSVGGSKALASLNVTAASTTVNGAALITTGAQTYDNAVSVNSSSTLRVAGSSLNITSADEALSLNATGTITLDAPASVAGPISISGGQVNLNANLTTSNGGDILISSSAGSGIVLNAARTLDAGSGDVTLTADSVSGGVLTVTSTGALAIEPYGSSFGSTFTLNGNWSLSSSLTGLTIGKSGNTAGITLANAQGIAGPVTVYGGAVNVNADLTSTAASGTGISLNGSQIVQSGGTTVSTGGSDIEYVVTNAPFSASVDYGINLNGSNGSTAVIDAGGGDIDLSASFAASGSGTNTGDRAIRVSYADISTSGSGAISITGDATNDTTTASAWGIQFYNSLVETAGGNIDITGTGGKASANSRGIAVDTSALSVLSQSGTITLADQRASGLTGTYTGMYFLPPSTSGIYFGADGSTVTTSTSDVSLIADAITFAANGVYKAQVNTSGDVVVQSDSSGFTSALDMSSLSVTGDPSSVTIGKTTNTANVTLGGAITAAGPISVYGGSITVNAALTATGSNVITLLGTGNITDGPSGYVNASSLLLLGADVTLDNTSNDVDTLAASGVGNLAYRDADALTIGTVSTKAGIGAFGTVDIGTLSGDLSLTEDVGTISAAGDAVVLNAGISAAAGNSNGGNIVVTSGKGVQVGAGGTAKLYTGSIAGSTNLAAMTGLGSGSGRFRYNSDETTANYTTALDTGLNAIFREQPSATLLVDNQDMTYGGAIPTLTGSESGLVNGDAPVYAVSGRLDSTSGNIKAGTYAIGTTSALADLGYAVSSTPGTLTVAQRTLTVGYAGVDREYDATTDATVTTSDDRVSGDVLSLSETASFADKNVGTARTVSVTGAGVSGTDAGNYVLASTTGSTTADITAKALTVSGITADDKVYDGDTGATVDTGGAVFTGMVTGDDLSVSATGDFADENVGDGKTVTLVSSYGGDDAGNYTITDQSSTTADITVRILNISYAGVDREYDGTTDATVTTSDDRVAGDDLSLSETASFGDKNVGTAKAVGVTGASLSGTDAGNYVLASTTGGTTADITAKALTVSGITAQDKEYDGTTGATVDTSGAVLGGLVTGDDLTVGATGSFGDKNVGTAKTVTLSSSYSGADAGNYAITDQATATADITAKALTVSGITAQDKEYDGTTGATVDTSGAVLGGMVTGDDLTVGATGSFGDKNVGTARTVTLSSSYSGADAGNYTITDQAGTTADITVRTLTVGYAGVNRVYDGTTDATVTASDDRVSGDVLTISRAAAFADRNVGTGKAVGVSGASLSGTDAGNYVLASTTGSATADITARTLNVGYAGVNRVYDGTTDATVTISDDRVSGDVLTISRAAAFADRNVGTGKAVSVTGASLSGTDAGNYVLASTTGSTTADITPAALVITTTDVSKVYDRTTAASGSAIVTGGTQLYGADVLSGGTFVFDNRNAGTGKTVTVSGVTVNDGNGGNNYSVSYQGNINGTITPKDISLTGLTAKNKTYDGNTAAAISSYGTLDGVIAGDSVTLDDGAASASFADPNPGTGKTVTVAGLQLAGLDLDNYAIGTQTTMADITSAENPPEIPAADPGAGSGGADSGAGRYVGGGSGSGAGSDPFSPPPLFDTGTGFNAGTGSEGAGADAAAGGADVGQAFPVTLEVDGDTAVLILGGGAAGVGADAASGEAAEATIPLFRQEGAAMVPVEQFVVTQQGGRETATPTGTSPVHGQAAPSEVGIRSATAPVDLPDETVSQLRVSFTPDGVLVVSVPAAIKQAYDERHILLLAVAIAEQRLDVKLSAITAVIFQEEGQ